jgi:FkbM family methyltransferase
MTLGLKLQDSRAATSIRRNIRQAAQHFGLDLHTWRPESSPEAAFAKMLTQHRIDTVLDVGANIGQYAQFLRTLKYKGRIVSFEPSNEAHMRLQKAAALDSLWAVAPRMALGDHDGIVQLNVASNNGASSSILPMLDIVQVSAPGVRCIDREQVPLHRLDDKANPFLTEARNLFLKIDVEGYELQVLSGAQETLRRAVGIQLELSFVPLYDGQTLFPGLVEYVSKRDFHICGIIPRFVNAFSGHLLAADVIFFRK